MNCHVHDTHACFFVQYGKHSHKPIIEFELEVRLGVVINALFVCDPVRANFRNF